MTYINFIFRFAAYLYFFLRELLVANIQVVKAVLSPRFTFKSAAIRYTSKVKTVPELIVLCNSITLTPGTLVMDADLERKEILIHVMSGESAKQIKADLHRTLEQRMLWAMRGRKNP